MTDQETKEKVGKIFRAARKLRAFTQVEMSQAINVAQGTVSKFESAQLIPDAGQWYHFCKVMELDADLTYRSGYIFNKKSNQKMSKHKFKIGKNKTGRTIKVKELIPFINCINTYNLQKKFHEVLKLKKIDGDIFAVAELDIPVEILELTIRFISENTKDKNLNNCVTSNFLDNFEFLTLGMLGKNSSSNILAEKLVKSLYTLGDVFEYKVHDKSVIVEIKEDFKELKLNESFTSNFIIYRTQLMKEIFKEKFGFQKTKISKINNFQYAVQYA